MLKNIIFDMGNVLLSWDPDQIVSSYLPEPEQQQLVKKELFGESEWRALDKGEITEQVLIEQVCKRLPNELHEKVVEIMDHWHEYLTPFEESDELIQELKQLGYQIYLLSNASQRFHQYEKEITVFSLFDGKLISADVHLTKPEKGIYQCLFDTFSLNPEECFFIDDMQENIDAAKEVGMDGYCYDGNMEKLRKALTKKGIAVQNKHACWWVSVTEDNQIETLASLAKEIWNQHFVPLIGQKQVDYMLNRFQSHPAMKQQIDQEGYEYFLIGYNDKYVGYTGIKQEDNRLFLSKLYLKKCYRNRGLARKTITFLTDICYQRNLSSIWLTVNRYNHNTIAAYEACGFTKIKEQVTDIGDGFVMDDFVMEKIIK